MVFNVDCPLWRLTSCLNMATYAIAVLCFFMCKLWYDNMTCNVVFIVLCFIMWFIQTRMVL